MWIGLEEDDRTTIKNTVLSCLDTEEKLIRNSTASVVASIAAIEVPRKTWPEIIKNLPPNAQIGSPAIRLSSVHAL